MMAREITRREDGMEAGEQDSAERERRGDRENRREKERHGPWEKLNEDEFHEG